MSASAKLSGRCFCGSVRWQSTGPVLWAGHCHCDSCRRATSSPFTSFFGVPRDSLTWHGEMAVHPTSNGKVQRQFCPACGTQMTYQFDGWPDETHLYAATLDEPSLFKPEAHYHYAERLPWVEVDDALTKHTGSSESSASLTD